MKYHLIDDRASYDQFVHENQSIDWIGLDTEFIGEKRFFTKLCLIQISTANGNYILDPIAFKETEYLDQLISDEQVVVITHAGANDYKLLYQEYGVIPKNTFDIQIAVAFLGHSFPVSFKYLVETFLNIHLAKSHTVTNWEKRPISPGMAKYAVKDVEYLGELYQILKKQLEDAGRLSWCIDECSKFTEDEFFKKDPYPELRTNAFFQKLKKKDRLVYMKMLDWRLSKAIKADKPKEAILPLKSMNVLTRLYNMSDQHIKEDRRVNPRVFDLLVKKIRPWINIQDDASYEGKLDQIKVINHRQENTLDYYIDLLCELIKLKSKLTNVAPEMVITKRIVKNINSGIEETPYKHKYGWRKELLGEKIIDWIENPQNINVEFRSDNESIIIS